MLSNRESEIIHNSILKYSDDKTILAYKEALKDEAAARQGISYLLSEDGLPVSEGMRNVLDAQIEGGIQSLKEKGLISDNNYIPLRRFASMLPNSIIEAYADPKPAFDKEAFQAILEKAFKGTVGRPEMPGFGVLLDSEVVLANANEFIKFGINMFPRAQTSAIKEAIAAKGFDAKGLYVFTHEVTPAMAAKLADALNLKKTWEDRLRSDEPGKAQGLG